jgi:hypothetical protein
VRRDWTVAHHGQLFQIETQIHTHEVLVEESLDGTVRVTVSRVAITPSPPRPVMVMAPSPRRLVKPKPTHPWHRRILPDHQTTAATTMTQPGHFYFGKKRTFLN